MPTTRSKSTNKKQKIVKKDLKKLEKIEKISSETTSSIDSEDEENLVRVGRVPSNWYEDLKHVGYDIHAKQIQKKKQTDQISKLIEQEENDDWWRTVHDELNNQDVVLTQEQLQVLERIRKGQMADKSLLEKDYYFEYDSKEGDFPLSGGAPQKKSFQPSKWEKMKVNKLIRAIKLNWIKPDQPKQSEEEKIYDAWEKETPENFTNNLPRIVAPKRKLPGHAESYNPSEEYLFNEEEKQKWLEQDPSDRDQNFIPQKIGTLRRIKAYDQFINEQFDRCIELYLCPRIQKKKLNINPDDLIPNLPKPQELRPFPTVQNIIFEGHQSRIRSLAIFHTGQYLASADEKGLLIIWDATTGRICQKLQFEGINYSIAWSKDPKGGIIGLANENQVFLINFDLLPELNYQNNKELIEESKQNYDSQPNHVIPWTYFDKKSQEYQQGQVIQIQFESRITQFVFHEKGDYFATVSPTSEKKNEQVFIHCISKGATQRPFSKSKGIVEKVAFHPLKPWLFLLTKKNVYVYNLQKQELVKKLISGAQWNSALSIHSTGYNLIVASQDKRVCWFDLELQNTPYKTLRYHSKMIRQVVFHQKYPLFASCSDDGTINIFHATVYDDLSQNPLIVPLKVLKGHAIKNELGVLDILFHPTQPWIFSSGADHKLILWT